MRTRTVWISVDLSGLLTPIPRRRLYHIADELAALPAANSAPEGEEWEREKSDSRRPRRRVEMAAGLAAQAYNFSLALRMDHLLNLDMSGPLVDVLEPAQPPG